MKVLLIGVGAAGNKAVLAVVDADNQVTMDDIVLINSTDKDIPKEYKGTKVIISPENSGCGKERSVAKEYILTAIQSGKLNLTDKVKDYDIVAIVTSMEGGTGSGSAPILAKYCYQMLGKNTHLIGFTGFEEDVRGLQNTVEFFQEIDEHIMVETIQNKAFLKAAGNYKFKAEQLANAELARRIKLISGEMLEDSEQNIDTTDIYKVVNTAGYTTVEYTELRESLVDNTDFDKICKAMIYNSKSLKGVNPGQSRMAVIMNISPVSEEAVDTSFRVFKDTYGNPYECFIHKQFDRDMPEFIAIISSGMKMPLEEVKAVHQRYMEESGKVNKGSDDFFSQIGGLKGIAEDSKFNMGRAGQKDTIGKEDFMKQFQTKPTKK